MSARRLRVGLVLAGLLTTALAVQDGSAYQRPGQTALITHGYDGKPSVNALDDPIGLSSWQSAISADGRYVAYSSAASNLVPGDINRAFDVFVYDRLTDTNELVDVNDKGEHTLPCSLTTAAGSSTPSMSADGRFIAFSSCATNLVPGDTNDASDIFLRDRVKKTTVRVSLTSTGAQANGSSGGPSVSPDGKYVAYGSSATNITPGDTNNASDVFLWNRLTHRVEMVSLSNKQTQVARGGSAASVSDDGRFVAFSSYAPDLVDNDTNNAIDVFVRDVRHRKTERVSIPTNGTGQGDSAAGFVASGGRGISADGRYIMISSTSTNFVPNDSNGTFDIFVYDRQRRRSERVTIGSTGRQADGASSPGSMSLDGRFVVVASSANNFSGDDKGMNGTNTTTVGPQPGDEDVFIYDRKFMTMEMVSVSTAGQQGSGICSGAALDPVHQLLSLDAGESFGPAVNADGSYVAFESCSPLSSTDTNTSEDEYLRSRGPSVGVGQISGTGSGSNVTVSGWATFSGAVVASATDKTGDADTTNAPSGDIVGAELLYRPEIGDLLARIDVTFMSRPAKTLTGVAAPGDPQVLYGMRFTINGVSYELRVNRLGADVGNPLDAAYGLFSCTEQVCTEVANLVGGYGTYGDGVMVSIPLSAVSPGGKPLGEGAAISAPRAFSGIGNYYLGLQQLVDQLTLTTKASVSVPRKTVTVTVGKTTRTATLSNGHYTASIPRSAFHGATRVTVRACLGGDCRSTVTTLRISG